MVKKNILLINPTENLSKEAEPYPSGALVLLGTMAYNLGHNVKIVHIGAERVTAEKLQDAVLTFKPDIVGITLNTFQTKSTKKITKLVKETDSNISVVVGGPHPSGLGARIFDDFPYIDAAVFGEGEHTFLEIVEGKSLAEIKGLAYKDELGKIKINESKPAAASLDHIPLSNLDLAGFNKNKFRGVEPVDALPAMYIMASRGCPFQCIYCNKSIWGHNTRFRKPELIIKEIKWLREKYGIKEIFFQDDTFNVNKKWAEQLLNLIIENGLNKDIVYKTCARANEALLSRGLLELMKKAGFRYIFYGVENGNQEMLNNMKKNLTIPELKRAFKLTHSVGIKTIGSFIIGLPGENKKTIEDTLKLWKELDPYLSGFSLAIPLPGTAFEKTLIEKGHLLDSNYNHYGFGACVVRTDELTKEDLEYYRTKIADQMEIVSLRKNLMHPIANREYFREKISRIFRDPKSAIRRLKSLNRSRNFN